MITREHAYKLRRMIEKASASLTDEDALEAVELFETWNGDGVSYKKDQRLRYGEKLYKVLQDHTSQANWTPDVAVSLYVEVEKPGSGDTPEDPIAYNNNMELFEGKYYSQDGVVYVCTRSTGAPVYNHLSALVGLYVEVWTGETEENPSTASRSPTPASRGGLEGGQVADGLAEGSETEEPPATKGRRK